MGASQPCRHPRFPHRTTCTQACGDVLKIDKKTNLRVTFLGAAAALPSTTQQDAVDADFFFGNFEQGRKFSLKSSWASLSLCRASKGSFYCIEAVRLINPQTQSAEGFETGFFFFLIRDMTTHSSSLSSLFPTGKRSAEKKSHIKSVKILF